MGLSLAGAPRLWPWPGRYVALIVGVAVPRFTLSPLFGHSNFDAQFIHWGMILGNCQWADISLLPFSEYS